MTHMIQTQASPHKYGVIGLWVLRALAALAFAGAGASKLAGAPAMVAVFATVGAGQWLRVATGLLEITGAIGLFVPRFTFYAAVLLASVMVGAIGAHLTVLGGNPTPPVVLLLLTGAIAWLSRPTRRVR